MQVTLIGLAVGVVINIVSVGAIEVSEANVLAFFDFAILSFFMAFVVLTGAQINAQVTSDTGDGGWGDGVMGVMGWWSEWKGGSDCRGCDPCALRVVF